MSVRINLEIGHEASIRTKRTQEGFTHDWEVYVRGSDGAPIHYYIEKVVFFLHETFPKPKRVLKDPPYSVKESGYAGFTLPIEVHLRNKDEPKKISFTYEINLQLTGATLFKVQKEKFVFNSPGEDFKSKLIKGGGSVVNSLSYPETSRENRLSEEKSQQLVSKPRLGGSDFNFKKHKLKPEESRPSNSFQDLFGTPITKTSKVSVEPKVVPKDKSNIISKPGSAEKEKFKSKHSPHKDRERNRDKDVERKVKDEKKREEKKEHSKDREDRVKEKKEKRDKSPKARSPTPSNKRSLSPLSSKYKDKEERKSDVVKVKKSDEKVKSEKKAKKERREKEQKETKHKERDILKAIDQKESSSREKESVREKEQSPLPMKIEKKEKIFKDKDVKEPKESDNSDKNCKLKYEDKPKHKHKKKDKDRKDKDKSSDREKSHKSDKRNIIDKSFVNNPSKYLDKDIQRESEKSNLFNNPKNSLLMEKGNEKLKKPLNTLLASYSDTESSNSSISSHGELSNETNRIESKKELFDSPPLKSELQLMETQSSSMESHSRKTEDKPETTKKPKRDKMKKNKDKKGDRNTEKRKKRKVESNFDDEPPEKFSKEESSCPPGGWGIVHDVEITDPYDEYMDLLKDLQNKIYALKDCDEIQQVVELIAETGRYEISQRTFDFDLVLLERATVTKLENFFNDMSS